MGREICPSYDLDRTQKHNGPRLPITELDNQHGQKPAHPTGCGLRAAQVQDDRGKCQSFRESFIIFVSSFILHSIEDKTHILK